MLVKVRDPMLAEKSRKLLKHVRTRYVPDHRFFRQGYAFWPIDITLQLTFACNIRCTNCYQHILRDSIYQGHEFKAQYFPSVENYKKFIFEARHMIPNIRLSGGEPFLYPDLFELARYIKTLNLPVTISTNGTLVCDHVQTILEHQVDFLIVSVNGPEKVHDRIVNKPGAFKATENGLREILAARKTTSAFFPRVIINFSCANDNQQYMMEMVDIAESLGIDSLTFTHLWYWNQNAVAQQNKEYPQFGYMEPTSTGALPGVDAQAMADLVQQIRKRKTTTRITFYPDLPAEDIITYYHHPEQALGAAECIVPWMVTYVRPNGDVAPCYLNNVVGNLKSQSFSEIWNGARYRELRMHLLKHKQFPACKRCTGLFLFRSGNDGRPAISLA